MLQFDPEKAVRSRCPASPQSVIVQFESSKQKVNQAVPRDRQASNRQEHLPGAHLVIGRRTTIKFLFSIKTRIYSSKPRAAFSREPVQQDKIRAVSIAPCSTASVPVLTYLHQKASRSLLLSRQRYHRQISQDDSQYSQASAALSLVSLLDASISITSAVGLHPVRSSHLCPRSAATQCCSKPSPATHAASSLAPPTALSLSLRYPIFSLASRGCNSAHSI